MRSIIVIGGGAAGLMAAIKAAEQGALVTLLEANEKPGKKLLATGNGRCNFTNVVQEKQYYRGSDPEYAWQILQQFPMQDTLQFFSRLGIYARNRNGWLYPNSDQAAAVLEVLLMEAYHRKVKIKTRESVCEILPGSEGWSVKTKTWEYGADAVIVACGSLASNVEGATDWGISLAKTLGLSVLPMLPALVGLRGKGNRFSRWTGVRIQAKATLYLQGVLMKSASGEIQLTEYGISGIPVFQLSRYALRALEEGSTALVELDFLPDFTEKQLAVNLENREENCPYKTLQEQLIGLLPSRLIPLIASGDSDEREVIRNCKHYPVIITGASSMKQAQVCSGGILTKNLDEHLQAKKYPGLYFAGEIVDVDGACGGYNLQWAWSSGAVAGLAAAKERL